MFNWAKEPQYKAPIDLWVRQVSNAVIKIELVRLPPRHCPKLGL